MDYEVDVTFTVKGRSPAEAASLIQEWLGKLHRNVGGPIFRVEMPFSDERRAA